MPQHQRIDQIKTEVGHVKDDALPPERRRGRVHKDAVASLVRLPNAGFLSPEVPDRSERIASSLATANRNGCSTLKWVRRRSIQTEKNLRML
jgi:hypothetical protein